MEQQSDLVGALACSLHQKALYNDGKVRAFVSRRGETRYDFGVRSWQDHKRRVIKFDESEEALHTALTSFAVPENEGWQPQ